MADVYFNEYEINFDSVLFCMLSAYKNVNPKRNIAYFCMTSSTRMQRAYSIMHYTEFPTVSVTVF